MFVVIRSSVGCGLRRGHARRLQFESGRGGRRQLGFRRRHRSSRRHWLRIALENRGDIGLRGVLGRHGPRRRVQWFQRGGVIRFGSGSGWWWLHDFRCWGRSGQRLQWRSVGGRWGEFRFGFRGRTGKRFQFGRGASHGRLGRGFSSWAGFSRGNWFQCGNDLLLRGFGRRWISVRFFLGWRRIRQRFPNVEFVSAEVTLHPGI